MTVLSLNIHIFNLQQADFVDVATMAVKDEQYKHDY
jgi:hypothetical protein